MSDNDQTRRSGPPGSPSKPPNDAPAELGVDEAFSEWDDVGPRRKESAERPVSLTTTAPELPTPDGAADNEPTAVGGYPKPSAARLEREARVRSAEILSVGQPDEVPQTQPIGTLHPPRESRPTQRPRDPSGLPMPAALEDPDNFDDLFPDPFEEAPPRAMRSLRPSVASARFADGEDSDEEDDAEGGTDRLVLEDEPFDDRSSSLMPTSDEHSDTKLSKFAPGAPRPSRLQRLVPREGDAQTSRETRTSSSPPGDDRGAAAALRTVRARKPRPEAFPLVGRTNDALASRRDLLKALAESASGPPKARLLVAAAELSEQLGQNETANDLYWAARRADPQDVVALRAARRLAMTKGDFSEMVALLDAEADLPLAGPERAHAYLLSAEVNLRQLGDAVAAERAARHALKQRPHSVAAALVLAESCFQQGRDNDAYVALERAVDGWNDPQARAALRVEVGRAAERNGEMARAQRAYEKAAEDDPSALDALIGIARTARANTHYEAASQAMLRAAELMGPGPLQEAILYNAATCLLYLAGKPKEAIDVLAGTRTAAALRAKASAAVLAGDAAARLSALDAWAQAAGGTDRALVLLEIAEIKAEKRDFEGMDEALRDAALADDTLGTVRVVRELLARQAGDVARLSRAVEVARGNEPGGALASAAKLAADPNTFERERDLLVRAVSDGDSPICADALLLDASAAANDLDETLAAIRRQADRSHPTRRIGSLLAMAQLVGRSGDMESAEALLRTARDLSPGDPSVLRPLSRLLSVMSPTDAASCWLEEAAAASGERAGFAATFAGRILEQAGGDAAEAYRRALDAQPGYLPAALSLESLARRAGDIWTLQDLHERQAQHMADPREVAGRLVRAALLRGSTEPERAAVLLERARTIQPDDTVLHDLLMRIDGALTPSERAAWLVRATQVGPKELIRSGRLQAGTVLEDAGEFAQAAELFRLVLGDNPDDAVAERALSRAELCAREHSRVAERLFRSVREAEDVEARIVALTELAQFDLHARGDAASAILSLQSILEVAPGHVPTLRALERYFLEQGRDDDLLGIEERLCRYLSRGRDVSAHLRLASRLRMRLLVDDPDSADALMISVAGHARMDLWYARKLEAAARSTADSLRLAEALTHVRDQLTGPLERATAALRLAEVLEDTESLTAAIGALAPAVVAAPDHPTAAEELGQLYEGSGALSQAADAYELAAEAARVTRRAAGLWYRAGVLWQRELKDDDRALAAFSAAADIDVGYADLFERMRHLLRGRGETDRLAALTATRIAAGGETSFLVELYLSLADLRRELGDTRAARDALRAALALEPERLDALRLLADFSVEEQDWRSAADALIRMARLRKEPEELKRVFFTLGDIYDVHMPDPRRAEAAFLRVLKLAPDDTAVLERLAQLYRRDGNLQEATKMLGQLIEFETDPERNRVHRVDLARTWEGLGDARNAEAVLEEARRLAPTDLGILQQLADFYSRQDARTALAMHINRAVSDFRHALDADPTDGAAWAGIVEVLNWRARKDAARCCASAAMSVGVVDVDLSRLLDANGGVIGAGAGATDADLDDLLAPPMLSASTRAVFRAAEVALEKVLPIDLKALRAEKLTGKTHPFFQPLEQCKKWFDVSDITLYVTAVTPHACVPITSSPITLLIGRELFKTTSELERLFMLVRAIKIARSRLAVAVRSRPNSLALGLTALVRVFDPAFSSAGFEIAELEDMTKRVAKALPRRAKSDLLANAVEMGGMAGFDPQRMAAVASELGDRVGLLAIGSTPVALSALMKLAGEHVAAAGSPSARISVMRRMPEAKALFSFSISDAYFEARLRTGAARR